MLKLRDLILLAALLLLLSGCSPQVSPGTSEPAIEEVEPISPNEAVESVVPAEPVADSCPEAAPGAEVLKQFRQAYCLRYPERYEVRRANDFQTSLVVGFREEDRPRLDIMVEAANDRTLDQIADELLNDYLPGSELSKLTVAGQEAIRLDNVPGFEISRRVLFIHEGRLYHLIFLPADASQADLYAQMEELYETVINSFAFVGTGAPISQPGAGPEVDFEVVMARAREIIEGVATPIPAPDGWTVAPCEGMAPMLCIKGDDVNTAVELGLYPLAKHWDFQAFMAENGIYPETMESGSEEHRTAAPQVLRTFVEDHMRVIAADRAFTFGDSLTFTPLEVEDISFGGLPGIQYGFVVTGTGGAVQERVIAFAAFDAEYLYIINGVYDPEYIPSFPSEDALLTFAPSLRQIVAQLPVIK